MEVKEKIESKALEHGNFRIVSSMSNQEQSSLLEINEINKDQCRLIARIDEALMTYDKHEKEQEILFFIMYCIVVLCILLVAVL
jgi:hypothetical protein